MSGNKLNACPFCYSSADLDTGFGQALVTCEGCGAQGKPYSLRHKHGGKWASDFAVEMWNSGQVFRHEESNSEGVCE